MAHWMYEIEGGSCGEGRVKADNEEAALDAVARKAARDGAWDELPALIRVAVSRIDSAEEAELREAPEDAEWDSGDVERIFRAMFGRKPEGDEDALSLCYSALPAEDDWTRARVLITADRDWHVNPSVATLRDHGLSESGHAL